MPDEKKPKTDTSAADAAVAEVSRPTVDWTHNGVSYSVDRQRLSAMEFLMPLEDGKNLNAFRWLIGDEQWQKFQAANGGPNGTSSATFLEFCDAMGEELGTGNS